MPQLEARPPTVVHSITSVTDSEAASLLTTYLELSETKPHLHPDADLFTDGAHFSTHGPRGGVILHLLRRVGLGLRGEVLLPETKKQLAEFEDEVEVVEETPVSSAQVAVGKWNAQSLGKRKRLDETRLDWEDPEQYQLEQDEETDATALGDMTDVEVGEVGAGSNVVGPVDGAPDVKEDDREPGRREQPEEYGDMVHEEKRELSKAEKQRRKEEKKKRRKEEKKERREGKVDKEERKKKKRKEKD